MRQFKVAFLAFGLLLATAGAAHADHRGFVSRWDVPQGMELPQGSHLDRYGNLSGPHGGGLTAARELLLETVIERGYVRVFAFDFYGDPIPARALQLRAVKLVVQGREQLVRLRPADRFSFEGFLGGGFQHGIPSGGYRGFDVIFPDPVFDGDHHDYDDDHPRWDRYEAPRPGYHRPWSGAPAKRPEWRARVQVRF
jgi:hypothetical protein